MNRLRQLFHIHWNRRLTFNNIQSLWLELKQNVIQIRRSTARKVLSVTSHVLKAGKGLTFFFSFLIIIMASLTAGRMKTNKDMQRYNSGSAGIIKTMT